MIRSDGYSRYNIWEHSTTVKELYARRCRLEAEEMTCHAQAAELLAPGIRQGDTLLDAGCGSGYFYHSLKKRGLAVEYFGIDATRALIEIGRKIMPAYGLPADRLMTLRIEDLDGDADHVVCINVLSNIDNFYRPLERLLKVARKTIILRESCGEQSEYAYVTDRFLDKGVDLKVHVNTYSLEVVTGFIESCGYSVKVVKDRRAGDGPEMVIGYPHYWKFLVCTRTPAR